jgi:hypothetical protein
VWRGCFRNCWFLLDSDPTQVRRHLGGTVELARCFGSHVSDAKCMIRKSGISESHPSVKPEGHISLLRPGKNTVSIRASGHSCVCVCVCVCVHENVLHRLTPHLSLRLLSRHFPRFLAVGDTVQHGQQLGGDSLPVLHTLPQRKPSCVSEEQADLPSLGR